MKNKKILLIFLVVLIILGIGVSFLIKDDNQNLNLVEKQWIETNKNKLIDMSIINEIPVLSYNGEGLILEFLTSLNEKTGLAFNKISYKSTETVKSDYSFKMVDSISDNELLLYTDNYVLLTKKDTYLSLDDLNELNIGVLSSDLENVNNYLYNSSATYSPYESLDLLIEAFNAEDTQINGIVLLKTVNLKTILENDYKIAYHINDYKKHFVLSLGNEEVLNSILTKYFNDWKETNFDKSYNRYLAKNYFNFESITDSDTVKFRSKRYYYGFVNNAPFDFIKDGKLAGINSELLSNFSMLTNAEISYEQYDNISELVNAFNTNQIDLFYNFSSNDEYALDIYETMPLYFNNLYVLKHSSSDLIIDSVKSLSNVSVVENSYIDTYLSSLGINTIKYDNISSLMNSINTDSVIVIDSNNYHYYKNILVDYVISYQFNISNNSFVNRNISDNKLFNEMLDFYISFIDTDKYVNAGLQQSVVVDKNNYALKTIAFILGSIVGILLIILAIIKLKSKRKSSNFSKEDKLRYIDALTSLKNRNYLNESIEKWDNTDVYPQTVIVIDLNNIAYVNDNYGHEEGDFVINQAANVLIVNQLENSEIIRTNGNEFLIYLIGYEEKYVVAYMRKLNKDLKELKHGFGAAIGYSMINDEIKTIDDAINEATIDMRNNKEETKE